jgi:hypothetical protein
MLPTDDKQPKISYISVPNGLFRQKLLLLKQPVPPTETEEDADLVTRRKQWYQNHQERIGWFAAG